MIRVEIDTRLLSQDQKKSLGTHAQKMAAAALRPGDRFRVTKCPGTKRWATFAGFDGYWIVSKSGISDYSPLQVDRVNDTTVNFADGWTGARP